MARPVAKPRQAQVIGETPNGDEKPKQAAVLLSLGITVMRGQFLRGEAGVYHSATRLFVPLPRERQEICRDISAAQGHGQERCEAA